MIRSQQAQISKFMTYIHNNCRVVNHNTLTNSDCHNRVEIIDLFGFLILFNNSIGLKNN